MELFVEIKDDQRHFQCIVAIIKTFTSLIHRFSYPFNASHIISLYSIATDEATVKSRLYPYISIWILLLFFFLFHSFSLDGCVECIFLCIFLSFLLKNSDYSWNTGFRFKYSLVFFFLFSCVVFLVLLVSVLLYVLL